MAAVLGAESRYPPGAAVGVVGVGRGGAGLAIHIGQGHQALRPHCLQQRLILEHHLACNTLHKAMS